MSKRLYLSIVFFVSCGLWTTIFGYDNPYNVSPKDYKNFYSQNFTDEQREAIVNFLEKTGLESQASARGLITGLREAHINSLLKQAAEDLCVGLDNQNFPKKMVYALQNSQLPEKFGKDFAAGFMKSLATPEFQKQLNQAAGDFGKAMETAAGKDSQMYKSAENVAADYKSLVNDFVKDAILNNTDALIMRGVAGLAASLVLWYGVPMSMKMLERHLTRPKLIIESSKKSLWDVFIHPIKAHTPVEMVFAPELKQYLDTIIQVTKAIFEKIKSGKTNVKYRNLLLYGPPGTGKTMFAKELAKRSGLEYVFMSGSSFSKFKDGEGIEALDELFAWANNSKGLMIFIDEAETFLMKRENMDPQSRAYQLLNNFLNYTGERSNKFMLVFATNHKDQLDSAMYRRIDDVVEMQLPSKKQRIETLNLYKKKILFDVSQNGEIFVNSVLKFLSSKKIEEISEKTKGFSFGDLEGLINMIKTDADALPKSMLDDALINKVIERYVKKYTTFTGSQNLAFVLD